MLARLDALDRRLSSRLVVAPRADGSPRTWLFLLRRFSEAGSYGVGWIVLFAVVGVVQGGWQAGLAASISVVVMLALNTVIKQLVRRPRPALRAIDHAPTTFSMPSAHAAMAMVGASTMQVLVPELAALWWLVAVGLAASRVLLGMHYLADVLVGMALGAACGLLLAAPIVERIGGG